MRPWGGFSHRFNPLTVGNLDTIVVISYTGLPTLLRVLTVSGMDL
jgi:hypothetical protein